MDVLEPSSGVVLPGRVPCIALHRRFARRVELGVKTLETRGRAWTRPPGWLVICAAKQLGAMPEDPPGVWIPDWECSTQALTCMVFIGGSRPLVEADRRAACFFEPGRHAWEITRRVVFPRVVPIAELGWAACPQSIRYIAGSVIEGIIAA